LREPFEGIELSASSQDESRVTYSIPDLGVALRINLKERPAKSLSR
jgi:hypothetical protein